jgi:hypothetical protein
MLIPQKCVGVSSSVLVHGVGSNDLVVPVWAEFLAFILVYWRLQIGDLSVLAHELHILRRYSRRLNLKLVDFERNLGRWSIIVTLGCFLFIFGLGVCVLLLGGCLLCCLLQFLELLELGSFHIILISIRLGIVRLCLSLGMGQMVMLMLGHWSYLVLNWLKGPSVVRRDCLFVT